MDGPVTVANTGLTKLTSAAAFTGGLTLEDGVQAIINLGAQQPGEGYVNVFMSLSASERETTLAARQDLIRRRFSPSSRRR